MIESMKLSIESSPSSPEKRTSKNKTMSYIDVPTHMNIKLDF